MTEQFNQYDVVRVTGILNGDVLADAPHDQRPPRVGDQATILEVYTNPRGYELECSDPDGTTIWLGGYSADDLGLELLWSAPRE